MKRPKRTHEKNCLQKRIMAAGICLSVTLVSLTACASPFSKGDSSENKGTQQTAQDASQTAGDTEKTRVDTGFILTDADSYDSADTPMLVEKNKDDNTVTFLNFDVNKRYTLSVDGTTKFYDKYGESISLEQIQCGDIVDVTFLKSKKHLTTMQLSTKAWSYENVERYEINTVRREVTIGQEIFKLSKDAEYWSGGRSIEEMELNPVDILSFQGIDKEILSVRVEKGHGYLRLVNDENFVGGWIEIGQSMIQRITEDMLLTVPEGSYQVNISNNGSGGTKSVIINSNEETTLDIGDLKVAEPQYGTILFSVSPSDAKIYIDGEEVDASQPVSLEYGIHQLIAKASGYQSITRYLRVGAESAGIDVVLDKVDVGTDSSTSSGSTGSSAASSSGNTNTSSTSSSSSSASTSSSSASASTDTSSSSTSSASSASSTTDTVTDYYKVYVDAPAGAEIYVDGNYVGISPCSFRKTSGSHVITLRKTGYETRSYTVQIDDEKKDFSYSFADLVALESKTSGQ